MGGHTKHRENKHSAIWILGGGKFGLISAKAARRIDPHGDIIVVEWDSDVCRDVESQGFTTVCADGIEYLTENLKDASEPEWIIPVIPVHVTFEWIRTKLSPKFHVEIVTVPDAVKNRVPNPAYGTGGELYMSLADFVCPENCPEPAKICAYTGEPRPYRLNEKLTEVTVDGFGSVVVRSRQLAPGVGGFKPSALFDALADVSAAETPVLLSTACSCHGVMHAFRLSPL